MNKFNAEEGNLQDWICINIQGFEIFFNDIERVITFHPPFLLDDLESFLVKELIIFMILRSFII